MYGYTGYSSKLNGRNAAGSPAGLPSGAKVRSQIPPLFLSGSRWFLDARSP